MDIMTREVEYFDGKQRCVGYLAWDNSVVSPRPGVLISPAWGGRDSFADQKAVQMAGLGYVGFAIDVYGDAAQPETTDEKMAAMGAIADDRDKLLTRVKAGMAAAQALDEIDGGHMAMMGFCFGGMCTLDMARRGADLKAAISFHGVIDDPDYKRKKSTAKVLVLHGWDDPMSDHESIVKLGEELNGLGMDWQLHAYGQTSHAFTVPGANDKKLGLDYNADADRRSWAAATDLLSEVFALHGTDQA
ncbi:dienelactone hydrolase family protein [Robiginitomaculum antarcticum]|uniref:dienelactone hydrolase family protein n=1 Tax=Robiginitomaculum antarcticum TaxID=437507 RepID=UPI00036A1FB3|nr:dienelactone hydrolase family protein [Robiginitomaculum antarcticum]